MFRAFCLAAFAMLCTGFFLSETRAAPYHAGLVRLVVEEDLEKAPVVIWYPTGIPEVSWQAGPFEITASRGVAVAKGRFPVLLLSHGHLGGPLSHRDFAAYLARQGYIVVAPTHLGDAAGHPIARQDQILVRRPRQAIAALDAAFKDDRFAAHANRARIGMIGYSAGGYTALMLAGAKPILRLRRPIARRMAALTPAPAGRSKTSGPGYQRRLPVGRRRLIPIP
nr:dienelactone hydrolase family protein [Marinicella sp. W31]MDC2879004.1 lipase family protein [Marinicella sp. W31]